MFRINTDEILRDFGDWRNINDVMAAGKIAVRRLKQYFAEGVTFNQETTLCGRSAINAIIKLSKRTSVRYGTRILSWKTCRSKYIYARVDKKRKLYGKNTSKDG